jgi:hypothetical protein
MPHTAHVSAQADQVQRLTLCAVLAAAPACALQAQHHVWLTVTLASSHTCSAAQKHTQQTQGSLTTLMPGGDVTKTEVAAAETSS